MRNDARGDAPGDVPGEPMPPRAARRILLHGLPAARRFEMVADLDDLYRARVRAHGLRYARQRYRRDVFSILVRPGLRRAPSGRAATSYDKARGPIMLKNYVLVALRTLRANKTFAFINIAGLAVGLACSLVIFLLVRDELRVDAFHARGDRIVRVVREWAANTSGPLAPALEADVPGVERAVRLFDSEPMLMRYGDRAFMEDGVLLAEAGFFDVFSFDLARGNPETALQAPYTAVVTEAVARRYFGDEDPVGKQLVVFGGDTEQSFEVTGVLAPVPGRSHLTFDLIASFATFEAEGYGFLTNWWTNPSLYTYALLAEGTTPEDLEAQMPALLRRHLGEDVDPLPILPVQPLRSIHLHSRLNNEIGPPGDIAYVYLFSSIAGFILLIACVNFVNLTTARSAGRAREIGLRKVVGANRGQLIRQLLGESVLLCALAMLLALALVRLLLPAINTLVGKSLQFDLWAHPVLLLLVPAFVGVVGVVAGCYPAFQLSGFQPVQVLRGSFFSSKRGARLRKGLVVFQFAATVVLFVGTAIVYRQLDYIRNAPLGFEKEQVVVMSFNEGVLRERYEALRNELLRDPNVRAVAAGSTVPGHSPSDYYYDAEGMPPDQTEQFVFDTYFIEPGFIETLGIEPILGRGFVRGRSEDERAFVLNEAAWKVLQAEAGATWDDPLGRELAFYRPGSAGWEVAKRGPVVGVVRDFHYASLHTSIGPMVLQVAGGTPGNVFARIAPQDPAGTLGHLERTWERFAENQPFDYMFLDEDFDRQYRVEAQLARIIGIFALIAMLVACLGLFGLATFMAQRRMREIGVRKVLGAGVARIVLMLSGEFTVLVAGAILIAWPVAYVVARRWLDDFAYRIDLEPGVFLLAGGLALAIAWGTVGYQAFRAARRNPVEVLRVE